MGLTATEIEAFLKEHDLFDSHTDFIWGTVGRSYFIISFCDKGICVLPVEPTGVLSGEIILLEKEKIATVEMKKKILGYKLIIKPGDAKLPTLKYTIRPIMIGYKRQKESIENISKRYLN